MPTFEERPVDERVIGILSAIKEPLPAADIARYAQATTEDVERIAGDSSKGIETSGTEERRYKASDETIAAQGDLKWAHGAIAKAALSKIPGFGTGKFGGRA